jgi:hypothetical protein
MRYRLQYEPVEAETASAVSGGRCLFLVEARTEEMEAMAATSS